MRSISVNRTIRGGFYFATIGVFCSLLSGCTSGSTYTQASMTADARTGLSRTFRTIIYFRQRAADNRQLSAAISEACRCQSVFLSSYSTDSLIYEIALPPGEKFETFETMLMRDAARLGIRTVEQDRIMQPQ